MDYNFEIDKINREIKKRKAKKVLIQLPEGLKQYSKKIMDQINAECILSGDPCFGACDLKEFPEFDLTIHFAHSKFPRTKSKNILFIECRSDLDITPSVNKAMKKLDKKVGLVTTVQHIHKLDEVKRILEKSGKKAFVGKSGNKALYNGQVLGCDFSAALSVKNKVDSFLFIGSGRFHPLGVAFFTGKSVIQANPYSNSAVEIKPAAWEKEKWIRVAKAQKAKSFGIVVGGKSGQKHLDLAEKLLGENCYLILMDEITPEKVDYLPFDAFVITACPRLVLDDWRNFKKPVLLPEEFKEVIQ